MRKIVRALGKSLAIEILFYLENHGECRYSEIKLLGHYTTVSKRLKEMERLGIVKRNIIAEYPPRVNYSLTGKGLKIAKLLKELENIA